MGCCCDDKTITVYKGFPTIWNGKSLIDVSFDTTIDLTDFSAIFKIGNVEKTYTDIAEGFSIDLTKEETGSLPVGLNYGELIIVDDETHKKPFTTALPFNVEDFVSGDVHLDNYSATVTTKIKRVPLSITIETATVDPSIILEYISEHNLDETAHPYILGELDKKVDKVSTANKVYGTDENGAQTTYDANSFGQVDDVQVGDVSVVENKIAKLGTMAGKSSNDYRTANDQDTIDNGIKDRLDNLATVATTGSYNDLINKPTTFTYEQGIASAVWTVQHNLNKYPSVTVVDSANNVIFPNVEYIDENTIRITMIGASKGRAYLN